MVFKQATLCHASDSLLVMIDIQERLTAAMPEVARRLLLHNSTILLKAASELDIPVLVSEQYPKGLGKTETNLAQQLPTHAQRFEKTCFSACGANDFMQAIDHSLRRRQVILVGMETHVCVLQTALELSARGLQVFVVEDASCSRNPTNAQNALARLRWAGVIVTSTESVLFEWLSDSSHECFKKLSALIR